MKLRPDTIRQRDRQILCGLFLSRFDQTALEYLGFESFTEAFNTLGYALQARPASVKNYRDELDPYFPNSRQGWHKRPLRDHCKRIMDDYKEATLAELGDLIKELLSPVDELDSLPEVRRVLTRRDEGESSSFAKRLITGRAAERYFVSNYEQMPEFSGQRLTDTTQWGCGFDFKVSPVEGDSYSAVEVKGLRTRFGQIQLTQLEHEMAGALKDRYYLVLVRSFAEDPFHTIVRNPRHCGLKFTRVERKEVRFSWTANIVE